MDAQGKRQDEQNALFECGAETGVNLLRQLAAGAPLVDFHRPPLNLEKVFMEVTQGE